MMNNVLYKPLVIDIVERALDIKIPRKRVIQENINGWRITGCKVIRSGTKDHGFRLDLTHEALTAGHMVTAIYTSVELVTYRGTRNDPNVSKFDLHDPRSVDAIVSDLRQRTRGL